MRPVIILFAKAPVPGRVKTRLITLLGQEGAAELHRAFVHDMFEKLVRLCGAANIELHTDVETDAWRDLNVMRRLQNPGPLGLKMFHALESALSAGRLQAVIVGSDAPSLPPEYIGRLLDSGADIALGPTDDGGYYAIACRRVHAAMFEGVEWSMPQTCAQTEWAVRVCGLTCERGLAWYDVDEPRDLDRLLAEPVVPAHTHAVLQRVLNERR